MTDDKDHDAEVMYLQIAIGDLIKDEPPGDALVALSRCINSTLIDMIGLADSSPPSEYAPTDWLYALQNLHRPFADAIGRLDVELHREEGGGIDA